VKTIVFWSLVIVFAFCAEFEVRAQNDRGSIKGTVTDNTGAVVPSVHVIAKRIATDENFKTETDGQGVYTLSQLPIGEYALQFDKSGFKKLNKLNIILETQHIIQIDALLEIGSISETVTVTTSAPVLEMQAEVGTNMNAQEMTDLPLSVSGGRDITNFAFAVAPNVGGSSWETNVGNSQAFTKSVLIDGTSSDSGIVGQIQESEPSMDAIQEAQVDSTGLRAEDGRSGGGAFLYELKSGTNTYHGTSFGFLANEMFNANTWDNKWYLSSCSSTDSTCKETYRRAKDRYQDYGFSGGGKIWRNWLHLKEMYAFAAYEKYDQEDWRENPSGGTVPTTKMLAGDFSELYTAATAAKGSSTCPTSPCPILTSDGITPFKDSAGNTIYYGQIFSPSGLAYSGNKITDTVSSLGSKIVDVYKKYYTPTRDGVINNYPSLYNTYPKFTQTQFSIKYDWKLAENDHVASSYIYVLRPRTHASSSLWQKGTKDGGPLTSAYVQTVITNAYRINETHTFSPSMINNAAFTFTAFQNKARPVNTLMSASDLGLGDYDSLPYFPEIGLNGWPNGVGEDWLGDNYVNGYVAYNGIVNDTFTKIKGRHLMKFGFEYRTLGFNYDNTGGALEYVFSNNTNAPTDSAVQSYVGYALANMMLGEVQSANREVTYTQDGRRKEISFFAQDDFRVSKRLTVNADLRWELTRPLHVIGGKWSNFDTNVSNSLFGNIPGTIVWLNHSNDSFETNIDWHQIGPKIGGSYQVNKKMIARASFGVNFVPVGWNQYYAVPYGANAGYTATDKVSEIAPQTAAFQWDKDPYPGVYTAPTGPCSTCKDLYSVWGPTSVDPASAKLAFIDNWYAGLQYELPGHAKIEISYMGTSGHNLHDGALNPHNYPTWSTYQPLLKSGHVSDWITNEAEATAAGVPYPYSGFTGDAYQAINPFPHVQSNTWGGVYFAGSPLGKSGYNAITVEGKKQGGSLNFDFSYNWARSTGNTNTALTEEWVFGKGFQDPYAYNHEATWPYYYQQFKGYLTYGLPLGKGRKYLSNLNHYFNPIVNGWTLGTILWYGQGSQISAISSSYSYSGWSGVYTDVVSHPDFKNKFKRWNPAWNPTVSGSGSDPDSLYVDTSNFSNPTWGNLGNSPSTFKHWRYWADPSEQLSIVKKTPIKGRAVVTLRAEFDNVFNRHYWNSPNLSYGSAYFGHVTGVSGNRTGQVGARFEW
jgi:hypothetical protein